MFNKDDAFRFRAFQNSHDMRRFGNRNINNNITNQVHARANGPRLQQPMMILPQQLPTQPFPPHRPDSQFYQQVALETARAARLTNSGSVDVVGQSTQVPLPQELRRDVPMQLPNVILPPREAPAMKNQDNRSQPDSAPAMNDQDSRSQSETAQPPTLTLSNQAVRQRLRASTPKKRNTHKQDQPGHKQRSMMFRWRLGSDEPDVSSDADVESPTVETPDVAGRKPPALRVSVTGPSFTYSEDDWRGLISVNARHLLNQELQVGAPKEQFGAQHVRKEWQKTCAKSAVDNRYEEAIAERDFAEDTETGLDDVFADIEAEIDRCEGEIQDALNYFHSPVEIAYTVDTFRSGWEADSSESAINGEDGSDEVDEQAAGTNSTSGADAHCGMFDPNHPDFGSFEPFSPCEDADPDHSLEKFDFEPFLRSPGLARSPTPDIKDYKFGRIDTLQDGDEENQPGLHRVLQRSDSPKPDQQAEESVVDLLEEQNAPSRMDDSPLEVNNARFEVLEQWPCYGDPDVFGPDPRQGLIDKYSREGPWVARPPSERAITPEQPAPKPCVIFLNGLPGIGKFSVAEWLKWRFRDRAIVMEHHLHKIVVEAIMSHDVMPIDGYAATYDKVRKSVRSNLFQHMRTLPLEVSIVLTDCIGTKEKDWLSMKDYLGLAAWRGAPFHWLNLTCTEDEHRTRLEHPDRFSVRGEKLRNWNTLVAMRANGLEKLMEPRDVEAFVREHPRGRIQRLEVYREIDTTKATPEEASKMICRLSHWKGCLR